MQQFEFDKNMNRLSEKWKNAFSNEQASIMWARWQKLPDGVFDTAVQMVLFKCTACPSGERIQVEIDETLEIRKRSGRDSGAKKNNGCKTCLGEGYLTAQNSVGNQCPFRCTTCGAKGLDITFPLPTWMEVQNKGYFKKKLPLSHAAKKHPEWVDADAGKYSAKQIAIFNTMQRSMLTNDQRGVRGISQTCGISYDEAFKIYELMREGNISHELILRTNNQNLNLQNKEARENT